jgi:Effector-associated domain 2
VDTFAWTVVGSVAGVIGAAAAIVFGIIPLLRKRKDAQQIPSLDASSNGSVGMNTTEDTQLISSSAEVSAAGLRSNVMPPKTQLAKQVVTSAEARAAPSKTALVTAVMGFADIEDPDFRRLVLQQMGDNLGLGRPFPVPYQSMARDHVTAIINRCWDFRDPDAARRALVDALSALRPYDAATDHLRSVI